MTKEEGIKQIDETPWVKDEFNTLHLYVTSPDDRLVDAWLVLRPIYCDRGHVQFCVDGPLELDRADSFPRYFFSFNEANQHVRIFLKWRLWQERTVGYEEVRSSFEKVKGVANFAATPTLPAKPD